MSIGPHAAAIIAQLDALPEFLVLLAVGGVALGIASFADVFRRGSVQGPDRLRSDEPLTPVWILMFIAMTVWVFVPATYATYKASQHTTGTTPSTEPATTASTAPASRPTLLNPQEMVILSILGSGAGLVTLVCGNLMIRPRLFVLVHELLAGAEGFDLKPKLRRLGMAPALLPRAIVPSAIAVVIVIPLMFVAGGLTELLWRVVGLEHFDAHPLLRMLDEAGSQWGMAAMVYLSAAVIAPLFEELLFRGHLQTATVYLLHRITTMPIGAPLAPTTESTTSPNAQIRWGAIAITSIFFAMVHGELWMMPPLFFLSLCLGYVYERTGNLWVSILLHAAFNALNITIFLLKG
jgi:membrane protease YdiL (CAAX protease family)